MAQGNRREFLGTAAAAAGTLAFRRAVHGAEPDKPAELKMGVIGVGWYGMVDAKAALKTGGVKIDVLRAIGGGAKSKLWLQLKADITGIPVVTPKITEAAGFGAALLAGVGAGIFPSAAEAANRFLQLTDEYDPDPARNAAYTRQFELYRQVYPAIAPITHQL
jgi:xylulokinase